RPARGAPPPPPAPARGCGRAPPPPLRRGRGVLPPRGRCPVSLRSPARCGPGARSTLLPCPVGCGDARPELAAMHPVLAEHALVCLGVGDRVPLLLAPDPEAGLVRLDDAGAPGGSQALIPPAAHPPAHLLLH